VLFSPKDIVSGDFYWTHERDEHWYFAAVDCTGHGVPGGFLTMLGTSFLNEIVSTNEILSPAQVMDELRAKLIKELASGETKEGMDMSLTKLNLKTLELEWSGANCPFWLIESESRQTHSDKDELKEIKPNYQPIGIYDNPIPFSNHKLQLKKGDRYYLFSDGYADQFGGTEEVRKRGGKKIKSKKFQELILTNAHLPMTDQKNFLLQYLKNWRMELEQNDDVLVMGVRL
jgi:serine phosphatase RsbU (regulator of sigma subunit)